MKSDSDLDQIAQAIRDSCQLVDPDYPRTRRKLLRDIQIDALREARNIMDSHAGRGEYATLPLPELEKLIRDLELR